MKSVPISFFYQVIFYQIFYCYCSHYYSYALELIAQDKMFFKFYEHFRLQCIEMAIWPLLYLHEKWCESNISGQVYVLSFHVKHFCKLLYGYMSNKFKTIKVTQNSLNLNIFTLQESRLASKLMFRAKLHCEII